MVSKDSSGPPEEETLSWAGRVWEKGARGGSQAFPRLDLRLSLKEQGNESIPLWMNGDGGVVGRNRRLRLAIAGLAAHQGSWRQRDELFGWDLRGLYAQASGKPNDAQAPSLAHPFLDPIASVPLPVGHRLKEQGQRHFKGVHLCPQGHFHTDGLHHLRKDQTGPDLCLDDQRFATPNQVQPQFPFEGQECQLDVPTTSVESSDL